MGKHIICARRLKNYQKKTSTHTEQIKFTLETLADSHQHFWNLSGDMNRNLAFAFDSNKEASSILWLQSADSFSKSGDTDTVRESLRETYKALTHVESVNIEYLNRANQLIENIDHTKFKHEVDIVDNEIKRLTKY